MTDAPERIWVQLGDIRGYGYPVELTDPASWAFRPYQPYVRADLLDALQAENDRLRDMISAFSKTARAEALSDMAELDADFLTDAEPHIPRAADTATIDGVSYTLTAADATTMTDDSDAPRTP